MTAEPMPMPQLQLFDKLLRIPLVECAYSTSTGVYQKVKGCNDIINWTLGSAEGAAALAMTAVAPVANKFQGPIHYVDSTLCSGIDAIQNKIPIVKEPPQQIIENAKNYVSNSAAVGTVQNITNAGWEKANNVLSNTTVGNLTLSGLDTTSSIADRYIDYYLPASDEEENIHRGSVTAHPSSDCEDKVLHAAHTVGALSAKVSRRIYSSISRRASRTDSQSSDSSHHSSDEEEEPAIF